MNGHKWSRCGPVLGTADTVSELLRVAREKAVAERKVTRRRKAIDKMWRGR